MARTPNLNYRLAGQTFDLCTEADEPFRKPDYQYLNAALDDHDHTQDHGKAAARFGTDSVGSDALVDAAVTFPKLATNTVPAAAFAQYAVLLGGIAPGAVQAAITRDGPLVFGNYADRSITGPKFAPATITADRIQGGAPPATPVPDGSITTAKLANNAVTSPKLALSSFTHPSYPCVRWIQHGQVDIGGGNPNPYTLSFADAAWRADDPTQTNPNLSDHSVWFNGEIGDPLHWIDPFGSHPTRFQPTIAGLYVLDLTLQIGNGSNVVGTYGTVDLRKNGSTILQRAKGAVFDGSGAGITTVFSAMVPIISQTYFNGSSDYVEFVVTWVPFGGDPAHLGFDEGRFSATWVSA